MDLPENMSGGALSAGTRVKARTLPSREVDPM